MKVPDRQATKHSTQLPLHSWFLKAWMILNLRTFFNDTGISQRATLQKKKSQWSTAPITYGSWNLLPATKAEALKYLMTWMILQDSLIRGPVRRAGLCRSISRDLFYLEAGSLISEFGPLWIRSRTFTCSRKATLGLPQTTTHCQMKTTMCIWLTTACKSLEKIMESMRRETL